MSIVYQLTFPDGTFYIGATVKPLANRISCHWQCVNKGGKSPLCSKLREFGTPEAKVLSRWDTREEGLEAERKAISRKKPPLNLQSGGPPSQSLKGNDYKKGVKESDETRVKKSEALKGNQNRRGIPHSLEAKSRIKASLLARRATNG